MRETSNYKLSQWDKTDRIEMEDFNEDNQKIDAALAAEKQARESADAAQASALRGELAAEKQARENADAAQLSTLRNENLWVKLWEKTLTGTETAVEIPTSNAGAYQCLELQFGVQGAKRVNLKLNDGASIYVSSSNTKSTWVPLYTQDSALIAAGGCIRLHDGGGQQLFGWGTGVYKYSSLCSIDEKGFATDNLPLSGVNKLILSGTNGFTAGSQFVLYGLKK